jgi:hypothetical protein
MKDGVGTGEKWPPGEPGNDGSPEDCITGARGPDPRPPSMRRPIIGEVVAGMHRGSAWHGPPSPLHGVRVSLSLTGRTEARGGHGRGGYRAISDQGSVAVRRGMVYG